MKERYARYSVCGKPSKSKFLGIFLTLFYKVKVINKEINGVKYIVEYARSPFWAYEEPSLKLFFSKKIKTWHGQVWEIFPRGGRCGFGTTCIEAMFPKKKMQAFLDRESMFVYYACYKKVLVNDEWKDE